jgi:serine protease Do
MSNQSSVRAWLIPLIAGIVGVFFGAAIVVSIGISYLTINSSLTGDDTVTEISELVVEGESVTTVEAVAATVSPSVVGIETVVSTGNSGYSYGESSESSVVGSGFIVSEDGYIATNQHVVAYDGTITVSLYSGEEYEAEVIWYDETLDLAIIKIDATGLSAVALGDSEDINIGETAIAIGNPLGLDYERTVTSGIVSALNRSILVDSYTIAEDLIQTDASINSGNSGGPLLNSEGEVIGITTYKITSSEGMGFAIPINILKPILEEVQETGTFTPTIMGVLCYDNAFAQYYLEDDEISFDNGVYIDEVTRSSGADNGGLEAGDVILKINDTEIDTMLKLKETLYYFDEGETVTVTYERNGTEYTTDVVLQSDTSS